MSFQSVDTNGSKDIQFISKNIPKHRNSPYKRSTLNTDTAWDEIKTFR